MSFFFPVKCLLVGGWGGVGWGGGPLDVFGLALGWQEGFGQDAQALFNELQRLLQKARGSVKALATRAGTSNPPNYGVAQGGLKVQARIS